MSSILDTNPPTVGIPPAVRIANELRRDAKVNFDRLVASHEAGLRKFWANPAATPGQIAEALGADAAEVFALHGTLAAVIRQVKPDQALSHVDDFGKYELRADGTLEIL